MTTPIKITDTGGEFPTSGSMKNYTISCDLECNNYKHGKAWVQG